MADRPSSSSWLWRFRGRQIPTLLAGLVLVTVLIVSIFASWIAPFDPTAQDYNAIFAPMSPTHLLGTDDLGRDIFSRLIHGAKASMYAAALSVVVAAIVGIPFGLVAGYLGGVVDGVISRVLDAALAFPGIIFAIGVTSVLGLGLTNAMLAVGLAFSPQVARLTRARALIVRKELYVEAAQCFGMPTTHILRRHVLPNALPPILVQLTLMLSIALLAEASLSFLGFGIQPPNPSWGAMLARAYLNIELVPDQMYAPGLAIFFTALSINILGDALRERLDPTTR